MQCCCALHRVFLPQRGGLVIHVFCTSSHHATLIRTGSQEQTTVWHLGTAILFWGAEAALGCRGTNVPVSPTKNTFPQWLGTSNVDTFLCRSQTVHTPGSTNRHIYSAFMATPCLTPKDMVPDTVCTQPAFLEHPPLSPCICFYDVLLHPKTSSCSLCANTSVLGLYPKHISCAGAYSMK